MREVELPQDLDAVLPADADGTGGPFTNPVEGENCRGGEWRRVEGTCSVGEMMLRKK